jgi:AraC-like DNA-binding protein
MERSDLAWPVRALPRLRVASQFPLAERGFAFAYRARTHALHLHDYYGTLRLGGREVRLSPGTLTLTPAGVPSWYDLPRPGLHWCVHFDPPRGRAGPSVRLPLVIELGVGAPEAARRFAGVARLLRLSHRPRAGPALDDAASLAFAELLTWAALLNVSDDPEPRTRAGHHATESAVRRVADYLDQHLDRPLPADRLATVAGLSQNYLARIFRRHTGTTLAAYTRARRVELAKLLLRTTGLPVKQVAIRVGLPDPQHFNKQFRRVVGVSPSTYRHQHA